MKPEIIPMRMIDERQAREGWGAAVILRLARDLRNDLPKEKGSSERNIGRMIAFYRTYPDPTTFLPPVVAELPDGAKVPQPAAQLDEREIVQPAVAQSSGVLSRSRWITESA